MRYLDIPYFKQDTDYSCGPASLQMILMYYGIRESEATLVAELQADPEQGTTHGHMIDTARKHGLHVYVNDSSSLEEMEYLISVCKVPCVIRYLETDDDEDHYAVVVGATDDTVTLNDPWHGKRVHFLRSAFEPRWTCDKLGTCSKWLMAVSNEAIPLGRQYHPYV